MHHSRSAIAIVSVIGAAVVLGATGCGVDVRVVAPGEAVDVVVKDEKGAVVLEKKGLKDGDEFSVSEKHATVSAKNAKGTTSTTLPERVSEVALPAPGVCIVVADLTDIYLTKHEEASVSSIPSISGISVDGRALAVPGLHKFYGIASLPKKIDMHNDVKDDISVVEPVDCALAKDGHALALDLMKRL